MSDHDLETGWAYERLDTEREVIDRLLDLSFSGEDFLFRGTTRQYANLLPVLPRVLAAAAPDQELRPIHLLGLEKTSFEEFQRSAAGYLRERDARTRLWTKDLWALEYLQHYGVPTRLLDWSKSPWIALYFAIESDPDFEGRIWWVNRSVLDEKIIRKWPELAIRYYHDYAGAAGTLFLSEPPDDAISILDHPTPVQRQDMQQGVFTIAANGARDHAPLIRELVGGRYCGIIDFPPEVKPSLHGLLYQMNVHASTLDLPRVDVVSQGVREAVVKDAERLAQALRTPIDQLGSISFDEETQ